MIDTRLKIYILRLSWHLIYWSTYVRQTCNMVCYLIIHSALYWVMWQAIRICDTIKLSRQAWRSYFYSPQFLITPYLTRNSTVPTCYYLEFFWTQMMNVRAGYGIIWPQFFSIEAILERLLILINFPIIVHAKHPRRMLRIISTYGCSAYLAEIVFNCWNILCSYTSLQILLFHIW